MKTTHKLAMGIAVIWSMFVSLAIYAESPTIPDKPGTVVISLDFEGSRLERIDPSPVLSILADGQIVMPQNYAHLRAYTGQLSPTELQDLLDFVVNRQQFFSYDAADVNSRNRQLQRQPLHVHHTTTIISAETATEKKTVTVAGLGREPMVEADKHILAIQNRLMHIMDTVKLGGEPGVQALLGRAAGFLKTASRTMPDIDSHDLESAGVRSDGSIHAVFVNDTSRLVIDVAADGSEQVTTYDK